MVDQHFLGGIGDIDPTHGHGDHFAAGRLGGAAVLVVALVFAGADNQARGQPPAGHFPGIVVGIGLGVAAADEMHDLQPVAVTYDGLRIGRARHDLQVAFKRDLARIQAQLIEQLADGQGRGEGACFAVNGHIHRSQVIRK